MKTRLRHPYGFLVSAERHVPRSSSERHGADEFVQPNETIEWSDIAERNGRIRSLPTDSLAHVMVTIRGPTDQLIWKADQPEVRAA